MWDIWHWKCYVKEWVGMNYNQKIVDIYAFYGNGKKQCNKNNQFEQRQIFRYGCRDVNILLHYHFCICLMCMVRSDISFFFLKNKRMFCQGWILCSSTVFIRYISSVVWIEYSIWRIVFFSLFLFADHYWKK